MKRIDFTQTGGMPLTQNLLDFMQQNYSGLSAAIAAMVGDNTIVSGVLPNRNGYADGWIVFGGELLPFYAGVGANFIVNETRKSYVFFDGQSKAVQLDRRVVCVSAVTPNSTAVSTLKRWNETAEQSIASGVFNIKITKENVSKLARIEGYLFIEASEGDAIFTAAGQNFNYPNTANLNINNSVIYSHYCFSLINNIFYQTIIRYNNGFVNVRILTGGTGLNNNNVFILLNHTVKTY